MLCLPDVVDLVDAGAHGLHGPFCLHGFLEDFPGVRARALEVGDELAYWWGGGGVVEEMEESEAVGMRCWTVKVEWIRRRCWIWVIGWLGVGG